MKRSQETLRIHVQAILRTKSHVVPFSLCQHFLFIYSFILFNVYFILFLVVMMLSHLGLPVKRHVILSFSLWRVLLCYGIKTLILSSH